MVRLYYGKRLDGYVTIPGVLLFKVAANWVQLEDNPLGLLKESFPRVFRTPSGL